MSPEPHDLSEALAHEADAASARPVDLDAVLRGSRARRRSRRRAVVAATTSIAGLLAVGGLVFAVGSTGPHTASSTADAPVAAESGSAPSDAAGGTEGSPVAPQDQARFGDDLRLALPETLNACGSPIAPATDAADAPLTVAVEPLAAPVASGGDAVATVRVVNSGADTFDGTVSAPAITVSDDGTTVWHPRLGSTAELVRVSLAPGASVLVTGSFEASSCATIADEGLDGDPAPLPAGAYGLSAALSITSADGTVDGLIVSPAASVSVG